MAPLEREIAADRPLPFRQFVLKVHSRCDLACDHCYVYEHADQSWRGRPKAMAEETAAQVAARIAEHAARHRLPEVRVVLHGGEPLLLGHDRTRALLKLLRNVIEPVTRLDLRVHTNGLTLDEEYCSLFSEYRVSVGVSLDGDRVANDRHRRFANGHSSHAHVLRALSLLRLPRYRHIYAGLLCTIDVSNDPIDVYRALVAEAPPRIDFLLPHATWDSPPQHSRSSEAEYADWLRRVFDEWTEAGRPVPIRTFDSLLAALHGLPSQTESLSLAPSDLVVIETDGAIEQADSLKTAFDGAPATGLNVFAHSLDDAAANTGIMARQQGLAGLSEQCRKCSVVAVCGGGLYAHRYSTAKGFNNPSVYCKDLMSLIKHVEHTDGRSATGPMPLHGVSEADLDALARGLGDAQTVTRLAEPQLSIRRALLAAVAAAVPSDRHFAAAWDLIAELDSSAPEALAHIMAHPYVRAWATRCLDQARDPEQRRIDAAYLGAVAVGALLQSRRAGSLPMSVREGSVYIVGYGAVAGIEGESEVVLDISPDGSELAVTAGRRTQRFTTANPEAATDAGPWRWLPARRLHAPGLSVAIEDLDPFRDCHQWPAAARLSASALAAWQRAFGSAMELLDDRMPQFAPALRSGLTTLMPLAAPSGGGQISASARHAFGAIGAALPEDSSALALLLVHEFQHVKLGAVLDLYTLFDSSDTRLYYAPWREDARPLEGLIQGTYAHVAVAAYWRALRSASNGAEAHRAEAQFVRWRTQTAEAIDVLRESGSLTPLGLRFVEGMAETLAPWLDEPVSREASAAAQLMSSGHRAAWRERVGQ